MGRYWVTLDGDGFWWTQEPSAHFEWGAVNLLESIRANFTKANPTADSVVDNFYTLPNHPWVMCRPRQVNPLWYQDDRLDNHVLRSGIEWAWSPEVAGFVREFEPSRHPNGVTYPKNLWQSVPVTADASPMIAPDWSVIQAVSGITIPAEMRVVGVASSNPAGVSLKDTTPYIQVNTQPAPYDVVAFGFGQYLLLFASGGVTLLASEVAGGAIARKLGYWSYAAPSGQTSVLAAHTFEQYVRSVLVVETPPGHLGLIFGGGNPAQVVETVPTESGIVASEIVNVASWWVAGAVGSRLSFQVQVAGFEDATTVVFESPTFTPDFDLGTSYLPNIEPGLDAQVALHANSIADLSFTKTTNSFEASSIFSLEEITLSLLNESGAAWSSDGTHHAGRWRLVMGTSTHGYLTPYIRDIALKFPVFLAPRINSPLQLDDTQFQTFTAETSYTDPDSKRVTVSLWDKGNAILRDAGFDTREGYPIQIFEDTDGDNIPDTLRVTGWVHNPEIEEYKAVVPGHGAVSLYRLHGKGLLSRGDTDWYLLPQMVDPNGGGWVEHTYAVQEAIAAMGLDITDPNQWAVAVDSMAGTARSRLPGTWNNKPYTLQLDPANVYAPKYDETKLAYAQRIATQWTGWVLYETLAGLVWYHPDLQFELCLGVNYYVSFPIYNNEVDANADGFARQKYLAGASLAVRPVVANSVRIIGKEGVEFDSVIANDSLGWQSGLYENFIGEPRSKTYALELAVDQDSARQLGAVALITLGQRGVDVPLEVPLPPWEFVTADQVEVGYVGDVQGIGDRLVTHIQVTLLRSSSDSLLKTRLTMTRLSANGAAAIPGVKPYPGRCITIIGP